MARFPILPKPTEAWPEEYAPYTDEAGFLTEELDDYIDRNGSYLGHLPREIIEQWPYRHFLATSYSHIPLKEISATSDYWSTSKVFGIAHKLDDDPADFLNDEDFWSQGIKSHVREHMLEHGTWYPAPVIMYNEDGYTDHGQPENNPYWLIEGHNRFEFLHYLDHINNCKDTHKVWIIEIGSGNYKQTIQGKTRDRMENLIYEANAAGWPKSREEFFRSLDLVNADLADLSRSPINDRKDLTRKQKIKWLQDHKQLIIEKARTRTIFMKGELDNLE